jgi:hypothetical protein
MRGGILLCLFALTGCYGPGSGDEGEGGEVELPVNSTGRTTGANGCVGGQLVFLFDQLRGDEVSGTAYYESDEMDGDRFRSTSRIEGTLEGDEIVLSDAEVIEADALPPDYRWCSGKYTLSRQGRGENTTFAGLFESPDCGCRNQTTLGTEDGER